MKNDIAEVVEAELIALAGALTEPADLECLRCFLLRMLAEFGCDSSYRWVIRWRGVRAQQATGLLARLEELGAGCDCEVLMNVFPYYPTDGRLVPCAGQPHQGSAMPCNLRALPRAA